MKVWESDKLKYDSGEMSVDEQLWYILDCFENQVIADETAEHGLNHELDQPQMTQTQAVEKLKILITGEAK
jgi:hypothetical protein